MAEWSVQCYGRAGVWYSWAWEEGQWPCLLTLRYFKTLALSIQLTAGVKDNALLEMDCQTWTSPVFSFPFQKWQNNGCSKSKEVKVCWFAVWNNLAICNGAWLIAQQIKIPQWNGRWDVLEDCAAFYPGRLCQAMCDAEYAVHSHSALPQAASPWHWDTATGSRNVPNTSTSFWHSCFWAACLYFPSPFAIFCASQLMCQLCHLLRVSEGSISLSFHSASCHEFTLCVLDSAAVSAPGVSLGLCHLGCALSLTPTLLLVPSCTPAVQDSDLLITPASQQNKHCFKRSLCLSLFLTSENVIWSTLSSHLKKRGSFV